MSTARTAALYAAALTLAAAAPAAAAPLKSLDEMLKEVARAAVADPALAGKRVAVVRFAVLHQGKRDYNRGPINLNTARKLEKRILIALGDQTGETFRLLRDASAPILEKGTFDYLSPDDAAARQRLFATPVPPAWGSAAPAKPEAVLTGLIQIDAAKPDAARVLVGVLTPGEKFRVLKPGGAFACDIRPALLMEAGLGFTQGSVYAKRRAKAAGLGGTQGPAPKTEEVKADTAAAAEAVTVDPATPDEKPDSPVSLEAYYDGKLQAVTSGPDGEPVVAEPPTGCKVEYRLIRRDTSSARFGVALRVNGISTIDATAVAPPQCRMWLLERPGDTVSVTGYLVQEGGKWKRYAFESVDEDDEKLAEVRESDDLGLIDMTIFKANDAEVPGVSEATEIARESAQSTMLAKTTAPKETLAETSEEAGFDDLTKSLGGSLGYVAPKSGVGSDAAATVKPFLNRELVSSSVIRYKSK